MAWSAVASPGGAGRAWPRTKRFISSCLALTDASLSSACPFATAAQVAGHPDADGRRGRAHPGLPCDRGDSSITAAVLAATPATSLPPVADLAAVTVRALQHVASRPPLTLCGGSARATPRRRRRGYTGTVSARRSPRSADQSRCRTRCRHGQPQVRDCLGSAGAAELGQHHRAKSAKLREQGHLGIPDDLERQGEQRRWDDDRAAHRPHCRGTDSVVRGDLARGPRRNGAQPRRRAGTRLLISGTHSPYKPQRISRVP